MWIVERPRGKWSDPGVPHKGWQCVGTEELDDLAICEMCETAEIRFAHHMQHPDYPAELTVGCHCAEHMEGDYVGPSAREAQLRNTAGARERWLTRRWRTSSHGNEFLKTRDGFHVVVWENRDGTWGGKVTDLRFVQEITSKRRHASKDVVKTAAFAAMQRLRQRRENTALNVRY
jgi:hypothetical protein